MTAAGGDITPRSAVVVGAGIVGLRSAPAPVTADALPIIGQTRQPGVFVAGGLSACAATKEGRATR